MKTINKSLAIQAIVVAVLVCLPGMGRRAFAGELLVSAASSLTLVMQEIGSDFSGRFPGIKLVFNFGATGSLLQQLKHSAPVDVFASASQAYMARAVTEGLVIPASQRDFAINRLVLAIPINGHAGVSNLQSLNSAQVGRIGLGNPKMVPAGRYGQQALERAGLWSILQDKIVFGNSVRQVRAYLATGEVDAALIYGSDVVLSAEKVKLVQEIPGPVEKIIYPAAIVQNSGNRHEAEKFLEYLGSDRAGQILIRHGFARP